MNRRLFLASVTSLFLLKPTESKAYNSTHGLGQYVSHKFSDYNYCTTLSIKYERGTEVYSCVSPSVKYKDKYKNIEQIMGRRKFCPYYLQQTDLYRYPVFCFKFEHDVFIHIYDVSDTYENYSSWEKSNGK